MNEDYWRLIEHDLCPGDFNMGADLVLLNSCENGTAPSTLRLYGWQTPTLSIGHNQNIDKEINIKHCRDLEIPVVRRPTGGKAILHGNEITYAIAVASNNPVFLGGIRESLKTIGSALIQGLEELEISGSILNEGNYSSSPEKLNSPACFASLNQFEILVDGKKLVGSAQKRTRKAFIQHGSILIDFDAELFISLLKINNTYSSKELIDKLHSSVVTLNQIRDEKFKFDEAVKALQIGFQKALPGNWSKGKLSNEEEILSKEFAKSVVL
jgi:lipoate-protein ligase A